MAARRRASSPINPLGSLVFTVGIVVFGILLYATTRLLTEPIPAHWIGNPPPLAEDAPDRPLYERIAAVTQRLEKGPLHLPTPVIEAQGGGAVRYEHRRYELSLAPDDAGSLRTALEAVRGSDPSVVVGVGEMEGGQRAEIGVDGLLTHTVVIRWRIQATPAPPRVAIVIDDMGNDLLAARDLLSLPYPVALAVMPFRPYSREVAESAHQRGREVLLHLPMEARSGEEHGEVQLLRVTDSPDQIVDALQRNLAAVPYIVGVNNHMGSRFTEDPVRMRLVLEALRPRKLFFLDSVTTKKSAARAVAQSVGVPYLAREIFLDDTVERAAIEQNLTALLGAAKQNGQAIAIGHPRPETLAALRSFGEAAKAEGVEIATLGALLGR